MACTVKLKERGEYKIFDTELEARTYIQENNLSIEEVTNPRTKEKEWYVNTNDTHTSVVDVIRLANTESWEDTKDLLTKTELNDWDTEEYGKMSKVVSLSVALSSLRVLKNDDYVRLFPEFITNNYLNVIVQRLIAAAYAESIGENINNPEVIENIRIQYFDNTLKSELKNSNKLSAQEWYNFFKNKVKAPEFVLDASTLEEFDNIAQQIHEDNFEIMLRGEIIHKIFETIIKNPNAKQALVWNKIIDLFNDFREKYGEKYTDVPNSLNIIDRVFNGSETSKNLESIFSSYYNAVVEAKKNIEESYLKSYRERGEHPTITWLAEQRLTGKLDSPINDKQQIRGKLDAILVIDGIPNVIDLKVSRNDISEWASEKVLKTKYQLAMYLRLLSKLGLSTNETNLDIYNISLNADGSANKGVLKSFTTAVKNDPNINANLNPYFSITTNTKVNPKQLEKITDAMEELFGLGSVKSQRKANVEQIIKALKRNLKDSKNNKNEYILHYKILKNTGTGEENRTVHIPKNQVDDRLEEIALEIAERNESKFKNRYNTLVSDIQEYLSRDNKDILEFAIANGEAAIINQLSALLIKYRGTGAKIIHSDLAEKFNLIIIKSSTGIDIIDCMSLNPNTPWDNTNKKAKLFDKIPNVVGDKNSKTLGNVEITKCLLIANELIGTSEERLGSITCLQLGTANGYRMTANNMLTNIDIATRHLKWRNNLTKGKFVDPLVNVLATFNNFLNTTKNLVNVGKFIKSSQIEGSIEKPKFDLFKQILSEKVNLSFIKQASYDLIDSNKIAILKALKEQLQKNFPTIFNSPTKVASVSPETILMWFIEQAIAIYENREMVCESDISKWGINTGSMFASLDLIPSENVQVLNKVIQGGFNRVGDNFNKYKAINRAATDKLKQSLGMSRFQQFIIGNHTSAYVNLFRRNSDGTLENNDYILKNPWTDQSLSEAQRNYIKHFLYTINKYSYDKKKYKWSSWKDLKEDQFQLEDFYIPLVRANGMDKWRDPNGGINMPSWKSWWQESINRWTYMKDTLEGQIEERKKASDSLGAVYNEFTNRKNLDVRKDLIEKNGGIENLSMDLELVLDTFVIAAESENIFNSQVIPVVKGSLYALQFQSNITGKELPNLIEFITTVVKSSIYNDSIMNAEARKAYRIVAPIRAAASSLALGWNIMNVPREIMMGFWTNISKAMFDSYGGETFGVKDYFKAMGIMHLDIPNFMFNVTKIELLNEFYRMANMSITEIPEQVTSNKTGMFAIFNRFMTWSLTAPDYWNRMTMFIAQMIHDGCWDAHELVEDEDGVKTLKYDMLKDKRFNIYTKYKGDYSKVPESLKAKFNEQEALYLIMREDMNKETPENFIPAPQPGKVVNLPKAYTDLQRNSFKSFADMSFGYYDKEMKAWFFKTAVGGIFKQFMAFLSAKKMMYFQVRTDQTSRGSYKQLTNVAGEKLWSIAVSNDPVDCKIVTDSELENEYKEYKVDAKPKLGWTGTYMEGIFQSYVHLFKDLGIGSYEALRNGNTKILKKLWNEYGKRGDIRHSNLLQGLYDLLISTLFITLIRMLFFDDPEMTGISYNKQLKESSSIFQNLYWVANQSTQDFSILRLIDQGLLTWEIPSFNIIQNSVMNFWRALGDDDLTLAEAALSGTVKSVGMFKPLRPGVEKMLEE